MSDKIFVDSNIFVYILSDDQRFREKALNILDSNPVISVQVVNENVMACVKKLKMSRADAFEHGRRLMSNCAVTSLNESAVHHAFSISTKYNYSFWDSLILASALENNCTIIYSEDMQHQQIIENSLTIINPFLF